MSPPRGINPPAPFRAEYPSNGALSLALPPELVEVVAERAAEIVAEIVAERLAPLTEPWVGVDQAAEHLACPKSRIYALVSAGRIPHEKDGSRLLFRRSGLDEWLEQGGGTRP